jgi:hypothetical protein
MKNGMVESIFARYRRYGWTVAGGEWGTIQAGGRTELHRALASGAPARLCAVLDQMFRGELAFGLASIPENVAATFPSVMSWRLALWAKMTPSPDVVRLTAPAVGNPPVIFTEGPGTAAVPVAPDTPRFDIYAGRIQRALPNGGTVLEIGGGYGGTALQILRSSSTTRVVLCDIPETLYLAGYWLAHATAHSVAWYDDDPTADVVLLPAHCRAEWTHPVDLVFSSHTLSGLEPVVIADYMAWLGTSGARYFYHDDVTRTVSGVWMTAQFAETLASAMTPPPPFALAWEESTPWTGIGDRFSEFFYEARP